MNLKNVTSALLVMAGLLSAKAELLYWQIDTAMDNIPEYAYAAIFSNNGTTSVALKSYGLDNGEVKQGDVIAPGGLYAADFTDSTATSFYVELFSKEGDMVASSGMVSKGDLSKFISSSSFDSGWQLANAWNGGTFTAAPEPTSGLLMILGAAMLGLRRKRVA